MEQSKGRSPFIDSLRNAIRVRHYSIRTEQSYVGWGYRQVNHGNDAYGIID